MDRNNRANEPFAAALGVQSDGGRHHCSVWGYMNSALSGLSQLNNQSDPIVLQTNFPPFIFGYMGMQLALENVFGKLYPHIQWPPTDQTKNKVYVVHNDGRVAPLVLPGPQLNGVNK